MIAKIYPDNHPDLSSAPDPSHPVRYFDIRKFTERECLRLMDVPEEHIQLLANSGALSRSTLYQMAGNSIVVSCLYHIFRNIWLTADDPADAYELFPEPTFRVPCPEKIRLVTLCSGYDSQAIALGRLVDAVNAAAGRKVTSYELMAWSEFDPDRARIPLERQPAIVAHNLLFPQWKDRNLGDMTKVDWEGFAAQLKERGEDDIDLLTYSTPCQSISQAGKREGMKRDSGTKSSILWQVEAAIRALRPKFLLQENVEALVNKLNLPDFEEWQSVCRSCGYDNYWTKMNARDFGVPQNRERVFMLSVRRDLGLPPYRFPNE